jgi:serine/threonine protein kinase
VGGYGQVALFQKRDDKNEVVDEVVCKEMEFIADDRRDDYEVDYKTNRRLLIEAAIQRDINSTHPDAAPFLRKYKVIPNGLEGNYRLYLEYCPHGDLHRLIKMYRCWDTFLPEVFVWHAFLDLAKSCEALRDCPPEDSKMLDFRRSRKAAGDLAGVRETLFALHMDMKPANTLLGYPRTTDEHDYPSALMSDYGMALYTSLSGQGSGFPNPQEVWWRGTTGYKANVSPLCGL